MKHTVEHLRFPEAPVEAVTEFRQVTGQMLLADALMDTADISFDIGDQGVDPWEDLRRLFPRTGNELLMTVGQGIREAIPLPTVGFDQHFFNQTRLYQGLNLLAGDSRDHMHNGKSGLIFRGFHRYHHLGLAGSTPIALPRLGSPEVSVVHLNQAGEFSKLSLRPRRPLVGTWFVFG
jgi:hypothetical protein